MSDFVEGYLRLLIMQYYEKSKAKGEMANFIQFFELMSSSMDSIMNAFDVETATGDILDKIGAVVCLKRQTEAMNDDEEYRFFIKAKIATNNHNGKITGEGGRSINEAIRFMLGPDAYVIDNQDMTLSLYVQEDVNIDRLRTLFRLDLLPRPAAVRYNKVEILTDDPHFGFDDNPNSRAFDSKNDPLYVNGGPFRRKLVL